MAKESLPAIHLYPGDWLRDAVSGCSLAAQGLWLRMMFVAHDSERYGYLEVNGSPMQPRHIAQRCGCELAQYESLLLELTDAGVPSVSDNKALFSRRMVKDANLRAVRAKSGRKGGKQNGSKRRSKIKANAEDEIEDVNDSDFDLFWKAFPPGRKHARAKARIAWDKARTKATAEVIIAAATEYAASEVGRGQYVKGPEPWLNGGCWDDDREAWRSRDGRPRDNSGLSASVGERSL
jgi:hypothetical protein